jgi:nucleoside-diphosphate-sugar epimerase
VAVYKGLLLPPLNYFIYINFDIFFIFPILCSITNLSKDLETFAKMSSQTPIVLITGVTGFIGFKVLQLALKSGHKVRATVRSQKKAEEVRSNSTIQPYLDNLELKVVPDIIEDGAYDEVVDESITHIIHLASPLALPTENAYEDIIKPAIHGTTNILEAAAKQSNIKRVIITSSIYAIGGPHLDLSRVYKYDTPLPAVDPHEKFSHSVFAYAASKTLALEATNKFLAEKKPSFDVVNILPGFVLGRNDVAKTRSQLLESSTNKIALSALLGVKSPTPYFNASVSVEDVAKLHVDSLKPSIPGNRNYLAISPPMHWNDAKEIVQKFYPEAVEKGILANNGDTPTADMLFETTEEERVFDFKFRTFEDNVKDIVGQYLELAEK